MKFDIGAIFSQIVSMYMRMPLAQKIALPFLIAGSVFAITFVSRWASRPDYALLFSGLQESDAASVVQYLKDKKIGFQLRDNGSAVEITPPDKVNEIRLDLASSGLPKGGNVGYEIFKDNALGRTAFAEKTMYIQALQGELERTIQSIGAIKNVRVHITKPERSVYTTKDVLPTASVLISLKPGSELTPLQIKGISNLVSNAVERLTPENVTIVDTAGNLLNEKKDAEALGGADVTRIDYQRKMESTYERRIESMLSEILGAGKAIARVTADLNFSKFEKEEEVFDPAGKVTRSERSVSEKAGLTAEGGQPGVVSNLTNQPGMLNAPDSAKNSNVRAESVTNYEVSRSVSRTTTQLGKINRLSVAVLVDGQYLGASGVEEEGAAENEYKPLTLEMMKQIDNLVKQAVGYDSSRGDVISVENIRFHAPDQSLEKVMSAANSNQMLYSVGSWALPLVLIVLFFTVIVRPMIRFLLNPTEAEVDLSRLLPAGIEELEAELEGERKRMTVLPEIENGPVIDIEELEGLLAENSRMVRENPQQAALLIRYWLNEGRA
ncbi:MAG: flagellar M-ring protein FliF [Deltaproteobacteria bacterium]|nr:flagellar M-ring protein FliF [Deltaproteobacteria bacterium]